MKLTKTPFFRGGGKLRGLAVAAAIGMSSVAAFGIDILDYAPAERIILTNRHVLVFRESGSIRIPAAGTVDILLVGGGGGGGANYSGQLQQGGGGGGGGGVVYKTAFSVTPGTYPLTVLFDTTVSGITKSPEGLVYPE